ncbi:nucleotidyltransferase domain-containing protein [Clostridium uliginosum]|uniref:Nucleotidyltransferase domain-containing protein n=1 Tax=Clostridium uliginosum TaxID=119641 RepID=A0A1I1MHN9_9CLOT|nr:nucleotidyltransferase domain-containing protein [Clostridium uliginosum]SFC84937.1 Nucleotidyltransferase domain-containing protein [Clostridium uliginosum]
MNSLYVPIYATLRKISIELDKLDFIKYVFVYGSVSKKHIHNDSDIDLLIIGTKDKNIELVNSLSKIFDDLDINVDVDFKYYEFNKFKIIYKTNTFLKYIEKDCKTIKEVQNELSRFCK